MPVVYVFQSEAGELKIGRTGNLARRLREVQAYSGPLLKVLHVLQLPQRAAVDVEGAIHRSLLKHRLHDEWFSGTPEVLDALEEFFNDAKERLAKGAPPTIEHGQCLEMKGLMGADVPNQEYSLEGYILAFRWKLSKPGTERDEILLSAVGALELAQLHGLEHIVHSFAREVCDAAGESETLALLTIEADVSIESRATHRTKPR